MGVSKESIGRFFNRESISRKTTSAIVKPTSNAYGWKVERLK